ncbi:oxidoreductase [Pseudonocardia sp.]|uniref:oxidoreductase n=1 Tax=Pseudonocardia sp. TaxID=60912 RepID=UPI003D124D3E
MARAATDPLAPLVELPGVADAVARARDAVVAVHNHPVNRRGWPATAAEAGLRAARASAALDGATLDPSPADVVTDPVLAGAVRAAEELGRLLGVWRTAPLQALARLHVVAAADLVPRAPGSPLADPADGAREGRASSAPASGGRAPAGRAPAGRAPDGGTPDGPTPVAAPDRAATGAATSALGRPSGSAETSARLSLLADLVTGGTSVPAPVLVAVVHGELLALTPFPTANGVVARAAARLAAIAAGLDPKGLAVPEVGHLRRAADYRRAAQGFASGTREGLTEWLLHCCAQWEAGAREGISIAAARG